MVPLLALEVKLQPSRAGNGVHTGGNDDHRFDVVLLVVPLVLYKPWAETTFIRKWMTG